MGVIETDHTPPTARRQYSRVQVGERFGRWEALRKEKLPTHSAWLCRCECGTERVIPTANLRNGGSKSCGCYRNERSKERFTTHGATGTAEYKAWSGMRRRCNDSGRKDYPDYGGRGIKVCVRWDSFENFLADVGPRPSAKHSLDRINVNGNYEPGNCRWATPTEQIRNRRPRRPFADRITVNEILAAHGLCF